MTEIPEHLLKRSRERRAAVRSTGQVPAHRRAVSSTGPMAEAQRLSDENYNYWELAVDRPAKAVQGVLACMEAQKHEARFDAASIRRHYRQANIVRVYAGFVSSREMVDCVDLRLGYSMSARTEETFLEGMAGRVAGFLDRKTSWDAPDSGEWPISISEFEETADAAESVHHYAWAEVIDTREPNSLGMTSFFGVGVEALGPDFTGEYTSRSAQLVSPERFQYPDLGGVYVDTLPYDFTYDVDALSDNVVGEFPVNWSKAMYGGSPQATTFEIVEGALEGLLVVNRQFTEPGSMSMVDFEANLQLAFAPVRRTL